MVCRHDVHVRREHRYCVNVVRDEVPSVRCRLALRVANGQHRHGVDALQRVVRITDDAVKSADWRRVAELPDLCDAEVDFRDADAARWLVTLGTCSQP